MAFIPEPDLGQTSLKTFFGSVGEPGNELPYAITRPIGYDDETDRTYFLEVILDKVPGGAQFSFYMSEREADGTEHIHWRGDGLHDLISREVRFLIQLELKWLALCAVEFTNKPESFSMITIDKDLPEKALRKYSSLANTFAVAGYAITLEKVHGQSIWTMVKKTDDDEEAAT